MDLLFTKRGRVYYSVSNLINNFTKYAKFAMEYFRSTKAMHTGWPPVSAHDILSLTTYFPNYQSI